MVECELRVHKKEKYRALRQFRQTNTRNDLELYTSARNKFKAVTRQCKNDYQKLNRRKLVESRNNSKSFWNNIKQSTNTNTHESNISEHITSVEWYNYFKNLFNESLDSANVDEIPILDNIRHDNDCEELNKQITGLEVRESVFSLHSGKSPGPDGICAELYKTTIDYTCPFLTRLFNEIFDKGVVPESFGESIISPIHKKGSLDDPGNFRGISLINTLCKIFMGIMSKRLQNWCDTYNVIDESQSGFRMHYSTIENIFCLQAVSQKYLSKPKILWSFHRLFKGV